MTTSYDLPMPNDSFDGGTVVASTWVNDTAEPAMALVIVLRPEVPFYVVDDIEALNGGEWRVDVRTGWNNINEAVADYADRGGDF